MIVSHLSSPTAAASPHAPADAPTACAAAKPPARKRRREPPIDLERVVWDPDYRALVRDRLNRRRARPRPAAKTG